VIEPSNNAENVNASLSFKTARSWIYPSRPNADQSKASVRWAKRAEAGLACCNALFSFILYLFGENLIGMFTDNPAVLSEAKNVLLVNVALQFAAGANMILFHSLKAVGDVYWPVVYSLVVTYAIALPLGWLVITQLEWGVLGLWYVLVLEEIVKATIMFHRWQQKKWTHYRLIERPTTN